MMPVPLTLIAALPHLFMINDFEEIIVRKAWMKKYASSVCDRFPRLIKSVLLLENMSSAAFAIAVAEEFLIVSIVTITAISGYFGTFVYTVWMALFWAFSIHLFIHVAQTIVLRQYVPGVLTSVITLFYTGYTIRVLFSVFTLEANILCALFGFTFMIFNLRFIHNLGEYLNNRIKDWM